MMQARACRENAESQTRGRHQSPGSAKGLPFERTYRFFDVSIRVRTDSRRILRLLRDLYPRACAPATGQETELVVRVNGGPTALRLRISTADHQYLVFETNQGIVLKCEDLRTSAVDWLSFDRQGEVHRVSADEITIQIDDHRIDQDESYLLAFVQMVFLRTIALLLPRHHLFHAAALSLNGSGLICPGESGQGKTMLSVALTKVGCQFLSDDIACLDLVSEKLEPFPRGLNFCPQSLPLLDLLIGHHGLEELRIDWPVDMETLFPGSRGHGCPLRWVILLNGFSEKPALEPVAKRDALWRALRLSHTPVTDPGRALFRLGSLFHHVHCYQLSVGGLEATADLLRRELQGEFRDAALAS